MNSKMIESESYLPKQEIPKDIDSQHFFMNELYEYRLNNIEKELCNIKDEGKSNYNTINGQIQKFEEKIENRYNRIEDRQYKIFYAIVGFVVLDLVLRNGKLILDFFLQANN